MNRSVLITVGAAIVAAAFGLLLGLSAGGNGAEPGPAFAGAMGSFTYAETREPAPSLTVEAEDGQRVTLADFRGRVVLINLWGTWCPPCIKEMPSLDRLQGRLGGAQFTVLPVAIEPQGWETITPFWERAGIRHLTTYLDADNQSMVAFQPRGLPVSILVDRQGRIMGQIEGEADWDSQDAQALIRWAIDQSPL